MRHEKSRGSAHCVRKRRHSKGGGDRLLAVDVGTRRSGVAYAEQSMGIPFPLTTLVHRSRADLDAQLLHLIEERNVDHVIFGLPLLPSGKEGKQAAFVRSVQAALAARGILTGFCDERYTSSRSRAVDGDAAAACAILSVFLDMQSAIS